jgi:hypothetical protein
MKKAILWFLRLVPCRSTKAVDSAWVDGFLAGSKSAGITREQNGRFKSVKQVRPRPRPVVRAQSKPL